MKYLKEYKYHRYYLNEDREIKWEEDWEEEDPDDPYKDYPEDFKNFLKEHNALEIYHRNFTNKNDFYFKKYHQGSIKKFIEKFFRHYWINYAFNWSLTQGSYYWQKIHESWKHL